MLRSVDIHREAISAPTATGTADAREHRYLEDRASAGPRPRDHLRHPPAPRRCPLPAGSAAGQRRDARKFFTALVIHINVCKPGDDLLDTAADPLAGKHAPPGSHTVPPVADSRRGSWVDRCRHTTVGS